MATSKKINPRDGLLPRSKKDQQGITANWDVIQPLIAGVQLREVRHVPKNNGHLTEIWREEWSLDTAPVKQVFQVFMNPGGVSAWHTHLKTTDRLFINHGLVKVVLYDARKKSPTHRRLNVFRLGTIRPALVVVPPGVWHGVQNLSDQPSLVLNLVDEPYRYEDPDHWRLPMDTPEIPYRFSNAEAF